LNGVFFRDEVDAIPFTYWRFRIYLV